MARYEHQANGADAQQPEASDGRAAVPDDASSPRCLPDTRRDDVAALRARARELESIMEMVPAVIFVAEDEQCRQIRTNRAGRELLRLPTGANASKSAPSEQIPTSFKVFKKGTEIPTDQLPVQLAARGIAVENFEEDIVFADGEVRHWIGNATPLLTEHGHLSGAVAAFIDITERKRIENALAASARQKDALYRLADRLQRTDSMEEIYDAALQAIVDAVQCDRASILLFDANDTMRFVGWRGLSADYRRSAEGHSPWKSSDKEAQPICMPELESAEIEEPLKSTIRNEGIRALAFIPLITGGRLIGKFMTYFDRPHAFSADEVELCLTIARQLAFGIDRKRAEIALREADRRKDEFLAMLAHELRNPLASITNAVQLLQSPHASDLIQQQARGIIERQAARLARLVDDLLEVSRITSGRIQLQMEPVALQGILERAVETVRPMLQGYRHALHFDVPTSTVWLNADSARIEQVFVNLVTNAAKYTEEGGTIRLSLQQEASCAVVRVTDSGSGIEPELLPHVFDLFTQGQRTLDRAQGGLGIGLSLVRRLVSMHGGTVSVRSKVGEGSEFTVRLPLLSAQRDSQDVPTQALSAPVARRLKVLVIDDNLDAAQSLALLLETSGHDVFTAYEGTAGIDLALRRRPDVVFIDIGLPGIDGYEVARRLREMVDLKGVLLVALTGYGQVSDRERSHAAGFDRHLIKPAEFAVIEEILGAL